MSVPLVNSCCFCVSLHLGTIIIGYLYSIWAVIELVAYSLLVTFHPLGHNGSVSVHKYALYITAAVVSGTHLLCSMLLIVAATKKLASLTLPWTIVTGILTAIMFVMCLTATSLVMQDTGDLLGVETFMIFFIFARACLSVYCIIVVHSRHKQIMHEEHERRFQHSGRIYKPVVMEDYAL